MQREGAVRDLPVIAPPSSAADRAKKSAALSSPSSHSPRQYAGFMCALMCCTGACAWHTEAQMLSWADTETWHGSCIL